MITMLSKLFVLLFFLTHLQIQSKVNLLESYLESKKKASYEQYSKNCLEKIPGKVAAMQTLFC